MNLKEYILEYVSSGRGRRNGFFMPKSLRIKDITEWLEVIGIPSIKNGGSGNEVCWFNRDGLEGKNLCIHFPSGPTGTPIQFVLFIEDDETVNFGCVDDIALGRLGKACRKTYDLTDKDEIKKYFQKIYEFATEWT